MTVVPWTPLLTGIVGSTAYGLATPESDIDLLSVAVAPSQALFGFTPPRDGTASRVTTNPDVTVHEIGKYLSLALKANPTVTELLWLPPDLYVADQTHVVGVDLIGIRQYLLGARAVRSAYLGYATSQFKKMQQRDDGSFSSDTKNRTAKHARHLMRLLTQGTEAYLTGALTIRLENPQDYRDFGDLVATDPERGLAVAKEKIASAEEIFDSMSSALPEEPDVRLVEDWLVATRWHFLRLEEN